MTKEARVVYFVSERTGITAESLGVMLLSQFPDVEFKKLRSPFINTIKRAEQLAKALEDSFNHDGRKALVFATMPDQRINNILQKAPCHYYELLHDYTRKISDAIQVPATLQSGLRHGLNNPSRYDERMDIVNYTLNHDDAMTFKSLDEADVILVGVSRSGKTPTCLYLALQFGVKADNYPLTEEDFTRGDLPLVLKKHNNKLIGLTITPRRLAEIREKRRAGSIYASLSQCQSEVRQAMRFFERYRLKVFDVTSSSIEELATRIIRESELG